MTHSILIKPAGFKVVDVFWDKGWNNWSRFEIKYFNGKMYLNLIKGASMTKEAFNELYTTLSSK